MVDAHNRFSTSQAPGYNQRHAARSRLDWRVHARNVFYRADALFSNGRDLDQELVLSLRDSRQTVQGLAEVLSVPEYEVLVHAEKLVREGLMTKHCHAYDLSPAMQLYIASALSSASSRAS